MRSPPYRPSCACRGNRSISSGCTTAMGAARYHPHNTKTIPQTFFYRIAASLYFWLPDVTLKKTPSLCRQRLAVRPSHANHLSLPSQPLCSQVASYCSTRMHEVVVEELRHKAEATACPLTDEAFVDALTASFLRVDAELATPPPPQPQTEGATDHRPAQALAPETVGSTSVVAIVSPKRIVVANTGD